ncbi:hypothetical protein Hanom_Chr07g00661551 [Helianthus anomalus]
MFDPTRPESNHRRSTRTYTSKLCDRIFFLDPLLSDPRTFFPSFATDYNDFNTS